MFNHRTFVKSWRERRCTSPPRRRSMESVSLGKLVVRLSSRSWPGKGAGFGKAFAAPVSVRVGDEAAGVGQCCPAGSDTFWGGNQTCVAVGRGGNLRRSQLWWCWRIQKEPRAPHGASAAADRAVRGFTFTHRENHWMYIINVGRTQKNPLLTPNPHFNPLVFSLFISKLF